MQQIRTDIDAEIKVVLTDEQYQKFQELPKGRRGGKGQKGWKDGERHKHRRAFHNEKINPSYWNKEQSWNQRFLMMIKLLLLN